MSEEKTTQELILEIVQDIQLTLNGDNGNKGIKTRVTVLEENDARRSRLEGWLVKGVATVFGTWVLWIASQIYRILEAKK